MRKLRATLNRLFIKLLRKTKYVQNLEKLLNLALEVLADINRQVKEWNKEMLQEEKKER